MKSIEEIRFQLSNGNYELSNHAYNRVVIRNITENEIISSGRNAIIIEDYPNDKYSPSCLLLGYTDDNEPLHIHVSRRDGSRTKIITIYHPDEFEWIDNMIRRS